MEVNWQIVSAIIALFALLMTITSVIFAILAFGRNKIKDNSEVASRLARIETDILYLRKAYDEDKAERKAKEEAFEKRLRKLENCAK